MRFSDSQADNYHKHRYKDRRLDHVEGRVWKAFKSHLELTGKKVKVRVTAAHKADRRLGSAVNYTRAVNRLTRGPREQIFNDASHLLSPTGLALQYQSLQFAVERKLWVCRINLGIAFVRHIHKTDVREPLKLSLHVTRVLFDHFGEAAYVHPEVGILRVDDDDFSSGF